MSPSQSPDKHIHSASVFAILPVNFISKYFDKEIYDIAKNIYINLISNDINKMYSTDFNPVKYSIQAAQRFVKFYKKNL